MVESKYQINCHRSLIMSPKLKSNPKLPIDRPNLYRKHRNYFNLKVELDIILGLLITKIINGCQIKRLTAMRNKFTITTLVVQEVNNWINKI